VLHLKFLLLPKPYHSLTEEFLTNPRACILMQWICGSFKSYVFNGTFKESHPMTCLGLCRHRGEVNLQAICGQHHAQALFTSGKDPVPVVTGGWVGPGSFWTGAENLALTRIRSPDDPARSKSLYRLSCPPRMPYAGN
jgi:hypothetical protein